MKKTLLTLASATAILIGVGAISMPASAGGPCSGGPNKCNTSLDSSVSNSGNSNSRAYGGNAKVKNSGNSYNDNYNRNSNTNRNKNKQSQDQYQGQLQGQLQGQSTDNANNSDQSTVVEGDVFEAAKIPVSTAYSAALTSAEDTCMGSTSAGVQGVSFGVSLGSTWRDEDCVRRKDSRMLYNMGLKDVALARMCQKADNRLAVEAAGGACPGTEASATPAAAVAANTATIAVPVGTGSIETTTINNTIGR